MEWLKKLLCIKRRETRPYQNGGAIPPFVEDPIETDQEKKERWRSIYVIYFTMFQMSLGFSIVLTGVWPYLDRLEPGLGKQWLGWAVGAHPAGQLAAAPLLGLWANRGRARPPLLVTLVLAAVASILYSSLHLARPHARAVMMVARLMLGISSANIAVARSYLSAASLVSERTRAVAGVSLAQVLGFVVGPALQAAAAPLGPGPGYVEPGQAQPWFRFDMYTAPGWMNAVLALLNILLFLPCCFKDRRVAVKEAMRAQGKNEKDTLAALKPDLISSWTLVLAFFVLVFNFVLLETLATSLTMDQFGWDEKTALTNMGALMSAGAVLACAVFALISPLCKVIDERDVLLWGGFFMVGLASLMCIPWGPGPPPLLLPASNGTELITGCPQLTQPWCAESRGLQLSQFLLGYTLVSVGYPIGVTLIQTIFSKVLGPRPQGIWMGILTGAGCLSRVVGPVFVSQVYAKFGPDATFTSTGTLTLATLLFMRILYNRLKPKELSAAPVEQEMRPLAHDGKENGHV